MSGLVGLSFRIRGRSLVPVLRLHFEQTRMSDVQTSGVMYFPVGHSRHVKFGMSDVGTYYPIFFIFCRSSRTSIEAARKKYPSAQIRPLGRPLSIEQPPESASSCRLA